MTPLDIRYELKKRGYSDAKIAELAEADKTTVDLAIKNKRPTGKVNAKIQGVIIGLLGKPEKEIWPPEEKAA